MLGYCLLLLLITATLSRCCCICFRAPYSTSSYHVAGLCPHASALQQPASRIRRTYCGAHKGRQRMGRAGCGQERASEQALMGGVGHAGWWWWWSRRFVIRCLLVNECSSVFILYCVTTEETCTGSGGGRAVGAAATTATTIHCCIPSIFIFGCI